MSKSMSLRLFGPLLVLLAQGQIWAGAAGKDSILKDKDLLKSLPPISQSQIKNPDSVDKGCLQFWNQLRALNLGEKLKVESNPFPNPSTCSNPPAALQHFHADYQEKFSVLQESYSKNPNMKSKGSKEKVEQDVDEMSDAAGGVLGASLFYRPVATAWILKDNDPKQSRDSQILKERFVGEAMTMLLTHQYTPESFGKFRTLTLRLLELDPNDAVTAKKFLVASMILSTCLNKGQEATDFWASMEPVRTQALKLNPNDQEVAEVAAIMQSAKGRGAVLYDAEDFKVVLKDTGANLIAQHPNWGIGYYYQGCGQWAVNDQAAAHASFEKAVNLEPRQQRFQNASKMVQDFKNTVQDGCPFESNF